MPQLLHHIWLQRKLPFLAFRLNFDVFPSVFQVLSLMDSSKFPSEYRDFFISVTYGVCYEECVELTSSETFCGLQLFADFSLKSSSAVQPDQKETRMEEP